MKRFTIIGAGSWGTALAIVLAENQFDVQIYTKNKQTAEKINHEHHNEKYLKNITLPNAIRATSSLEEAFSFSKNILFAVPSHGMRETCKESSPFVTKKHLLVHATKGIENETLKRMSQIIQEEIHDYPKENIVVLSGPSHAEEVVRKLPTTIVSVSENESLAHHVQRAFHNQYFRVYTEKDVIGVELGGALKNVIALGAGLADGLGYGDNGKAALLTRGLAEIVRLGVKMGAQKETFSGLTGMGDLFVTGNSKHSRNWRTGYLLSQGMTLDETLNEIGMVAEGVKTTKSAYSLAKELQVETPIIDELYQILFENKDPNQATKDLFNRKHKPEKG